MSNAFMTDDGWIWAMRRRQLPDLHRGPFDYDVCIKRAPHPSPEFKNVMVWMTKRVETISLGKLFKKAYSSQISKLLPDESALGKLK